VYRLTVRRVRAIILIVCAVLVAGAVPDAQRRQPAKRTKKAAPLPLKTEMAKVTCREPLGAGVRTLAQYCFVLAGRDPAKGVVVAIPPHTGNAMLLFDLHNRHTYSEEETKAGRGYARYLAIIGVLTMKGELLSRAAVQSEFRRAADLYERVTGGAGPGGLKAVAPIGREQIAIQIPAAVDEVSLLGEVLNAETVAGREVATPGRPVAIVSNVRVEYRPAKGKG
jgi:hypothetical protein